jgi:hypothetical protein
MAHYRQKSKSMYRHRFKSRQGPSRKYRELQGRVHAGVVAKNGANAVGNRQPTVNPLCHYEELVGCYNESQR